MKIYLVGGAVRDQLLNLAIQEQDWVVVGSTPDEMLQLGFIPVGKFFPVFLHPETKEEYALARTERKVAGGYHGFTFNTSPDVTLEEDLKRRDLTINAIALDPTGSIIDPYGGQQDLDKRILRHVSSAFSEDPVRVLRIARLAARFSNLGFHIAKETLALMQKMVNEGELNYLVPERVWKEMVKALSERSPEVFIQVLRQCGALKILFPEIDALYGVPQVLEYHPERDTGIHIELVLAQAAKLSNEPEVRFASLMHDVGKALTPESLLPQHPEHEQKGEALTKALCQRLRVPTAFQSLAQLVTKYHGECHSILGKDPEEVLSLLEKCDAFRRPHRFAQFLLACLADCRGRPGFEQHPYPQHQYLSQALAAAQQVDVKKVIASLSSRDGETVKMAIHQARVAAIESISQPGLK